MAPPRFICVGPEAEVMLNVKLVRPGDAKAGWAHEPSLVAPSTQGRSILEAMAATFEARRVCWSRRVGTWKQPSSSLCTL